MSSYPRSMKKEKNMIRGFFCPVSEQASAYIRTQCCRPFRTSSIHTPRTPYVVVYGWENTNAHAGSRRYRSSEGPNSEKPPM